MFKLNKETEFILGRPNFWCGPLAEVLRGCGKEIKRHAEEEQAAVIYWMLEMYEEYGDEWRDKSQEWLKTHNPCFKRTAK